MSRVKIRTQDGHLLFMVADDRNISLLTGKNGAILLNGQDISAAYQTVIIKLIQGFTWFGCNELTAKL